MDDQADDVFLCHLLSEMAELEKRPVAEVGVPMFLIPEDLTAEPETDMPDEASVDPIGAAFARGLRLLESHRGQLVAADVARLAEVLAHRAFGLLGPAGA